jgi:DUF1680 family protein
MVTRRLAMDSVFKRFNLDEVRLLPGLLQSRASLNRNYMMSLGNQNLLNHFYMEAGMSAFTGDQKDWSWGWDAPTCQLRGHFTGHWLSAAARVYASTNDTEIKAKADHIVSELGRCQEENGGEWVGSIPEKYFHRIARGRSVWAPHYTVHKLFMGLWDMYSLAGNEQAFDILVKWANWFHRWTGQFSREEIDNILDYETGGMLEIWADLYGVTGKQEHLELIQRYDRKRLFDRLLDGQDVLTNKHANGSIPEVIGAARAWEVTGDKRWRDIVDAYWRLAVTERGYFCTGGQTSGEVWTPPFEFSARLNANQEHCAVYNMMRLAEILLKWTGDVSYADYWERNLYNGILAQQNPRTGMVAYFLDLCGGAKKHWGRPTQDFWCCHGTLVQAHSAHGSTAYYEDKDGLVVCQYIPSVLSWNRSGNNVRLTQTVALQHEGLYTVHRTPGRTHRPKSMAFSISIECDRPQEFTLKIRRPWWVKGTPTITVNGDTATPGTSTAGYYEIRRTWDKDRIFVELPKELTTCPIPDMPEMVAFMDGPVVLAGICDEERTVYGDPDKPEDTLTPDYERHHGTWLEGYRTRNQDRNFRVIPLHEVTDERYTVYFPMKKA